VARALDAALGARGTLISLAEATDKPGIGDRAGHPQLRPAHDANPPVGEEPTATGATSVDESVDDTSFRDEAVWTPETASPEAVGQLRQILVVYARADNLVGPLHVIDPLLAHLRSLKRLLGVTRAEARVDLLAVAARYAEFAGWLFQDCGRMNAAQRCCDRALEWAHESGERLMVSYTLMRKSNLASAVGDGPRAVGLAQAALRGDGRLPARARALALRQLAHGHALIRDVRECERALDAAREELIDPAPHEHDDDGLAGYCTLEYIDMEEAQCRLVLDQPDTAVRVISDALESWPFGYRRDQGLHLARLALAHASVGDLAQSAAAAFDALAVARATGSARTARELRRLITQWPTAPARAELAEALNRLPSCGRVPPDGSP
jgi:hypothetical protein